MSDQNFTVTLHHSLLDEILEIYRRQIGQQWTGYRNHCLTVYNIVRSNARLTEHEDKLVAITVAFHDLALWSDDNFDYIDPSADRAKQWCAENGFGADSQLVADMIFYHHKIFPASLSRNHPLIKAFRDADWSAFTSGWIPFDRGKKKRRAIAAALPNAGFHAFLIKRTFRHFREGGILNPFPMMKI